MLSPSCTPDGEARVNRVSIEQWSPAALRDASLNQELDMLARVLHSAVHAGASVSFILPFSEDDARAFWSDRVFPGILSGSRALLVARCGGEIVGTVQLSLEVPPNQGHRAEVTKLLVHPKARRRGIARALMSAVEEVAGAHGRTLLTLDTRHGDMAEPLYLSMGYILAGIIPRYARDPREPRLEATSILYKELPGQG
jgi:ribosomal protein S18 acetylase RimI-like enzyme